MARTADAYRSVFSTLQPCFMFYRFFPLGILDSAPSLRRLFTRFFRLVSSALPSQCPRWQTAQLGSNSRTHTKSNNGPGKAQDKRTIATPSVRRTGTMQPPNAPKSWLLNAAIVRATPKDFRRIIQTNCCMFCKQ